MAITFYTWYIMYRLQKSVGSIEPIEPTLTPPLSTWKRVEFQPTLCHIINGWPLSFVDGPWKSFPLPKVAFWWMNFTKNPVNLCESKGYNHKNLSPYLSKWVIFKHDGRVGPCLYVASVGRVIGTAGAVSNCWIVLGKGWSFSQLCATRYYCGDQTLYIFRNEC